MGYKAVLNGAFSFRGLDLSSDKIMAAIIRTYCHQVHHLDAKEQAGNADVILWALLMTPLK